MLAVTTKVLHKAKNLTSYLIGQRFKNLRDKIRMRLFRFHLDRELQLPRVLQQIPVRTVYLFAEAKLPAESLFHGELMCCSGRHAVRALMSQIC